MSTPTLTTRQVADRFGVNPQTVISWANAGKLPHFRTLGGHRRYLLSDVDVLHEAQTVTVDGDAA